MAKQYSLVFSSDEEQEGSAAGDLMAGLLNQIRTKKRDPRKLEGVKEKQVKASHKERTRKSEQSVPKKRRNSDSLKQVKKSVSKKGKKTKEATKKKSKRKAKQRGKNSEAAQLSDSLRNEYLGK